MGGLLDVLRSHQGRKLIIAYADRVTQPGYHVTEVKAGSFVTLDCGGNPNAWRETILQVEDLPASAATPEHMTAKRFIAILDKVAQQVTLDRAARLTFEVGPADQPMQIFDVVAVRIEAEWITVQLAGRPAICKPRHCAEQQAAAAACCKAANGCFGG